MHFLKLSVLFVLVSCSWSQAEFRKWAQKDDKGPDNELEKVGANEEELEKFKVEAAPVEPVVAPPAEQPIAAPTSPSSKPKAAVRPAPTPAKKPVAPVKPAPVKEVPPIVAGFSYPKDMPEEVRKLDERAAKTWDAFKPSFTNNEAEFLDVDYLGMTVGKVSMRYVGGKIMNGEEVYHFQARFKSAPFYSAIYELNDTIDTYVDKKTFTGRRYNLVQRESKQSVDEVQLYDQDKLRTTSYQKRERDGKTKKKQWDGWMPRYNIDSFSAIYLIRGLPLNVGESYAFTIVNKAKLLTMELKVELKEKITIKGKEKAAIKVHAFTKYTGSTLKSGDMTFWLSDTPSRDLLRCRAEIKIGSVYAELSDKE